MGRIIKDMDFVGCSREFQWLINNLTTVDNFIIKVFGELIFTEMRKG